MSDSPRSRSDEAVSAAGEAATAAEQFPLDPSPLLPPCIFDEETKSGRSSGSTAAAMSPEPLAELSASLKRALSPLPPPTYGEQCNNGSPASMAAATRIRFLPRELPAGMTSPFAMSSATMETHVLDVESPGATLKRKVIIFLLWYFSRTSRYEKVKNILLRIILYDFYPHSIDPIS